MFNKLTTKAEDESGFTLIELLVVILIIGILAAIAIPVFLNQQKVAVNAGVRSDVRNTQANVALFISAHPGASTDANVSAIGNVKAETAITPAVVVSDTETAVAVKFTAIGTYTVTGTSGKTNFTYVFDSSTGKYA